MCNPMRLFTAMLLLLWIIFGATVTHEKHLPHVERGGHSSWFAEYMNAKGSLIRIRQLIQRVLLGIKRRPLNARRSVAQAILSSRSR